MNSIDNNKANAMDIEDIGKQTVININNNYDINKDNNKDNKDNDINIDNNDNNIYDINNKEHTPPKKERKALIRLPFAKIKNIIKMDKDIKQCLKNSYYIIGKMTELFLKTIAEDSEKYCRLSKRKTINIEDITKAIERDDKYAFIDISSIFHIETKKRNKSTETRVIKKEEKSKRNKSEKKNKTIESMLNYNKK